MNSPLNTTTLACGLLGMLLATNVPAGSNPAAIDDELIEERTLFSFEGGTAEELFAELNTSYPEYPVVLGDRARNFEIPSFTALISEPGTIVELVCGMEGWCRFEGNSVRGMLDYRYVNLELIGINFSETGFVTDRSHVRVISIQELLAVGMSIEEITGTVRAAIEIQCEDPTDPPATVRLHEQTGVLFIRGSKAAIDLVAQTVDALSVSAQWRIDSDATEAVEAAIRSAGPE